MESVSYQFAHPEFLWLLLLLAVLVVLKLWKLRGVAAFGFPSVSDVRAAGGESRRWVDTLLIVLKIVGLVGLILALARPQIGRGSTEIEASGIDIILALDVSSSMYAHDFKLAGHPTSRIEAVKRVVEDFIKERPNDRMGIVAFAGKPYLVSPLTLDHDWLSRRLKTVQIGQVEDGTAVGSAIVSASNHLKEQEAKSRIVILLTDGVNNAGAVTPMTAAEAAKALKIKVYTVGAGTRGLAPYPVRNSRRMVMRQVDIDEETLTNVAKETGGQYYRATDTTEMANIYDAINELEKTTRKLKKYENIEELFLWALIPGMLLIAIERSLSETIFRRLP